MNKNKFAATPPMGWNSYDYYDSFDAVDIFPFPADGRCRADKAG